MKALSKKIGLFSAVIVQTNAMIGAGVVAIPAILAQTTGVLGLFSFVFCIVIILCMSFSLGELSLLHGGKAWCYRFPFLWGKHIGGTIGAVCYVIGVLVALGFVAQQAGVWLHEVIPFLNSNALCLVVLGTLTAFVLAGKNVSAFWQYVYSSMIFLGIVTTTVLCFMNFSEEVLLDKPQGGMQALWWATPILLFSFLGFESITSLYGIVKNPRRNVFIGGIIGVICVGVLYMVFSASILGSIPFRDFVVLKDRSLATVIAVALPKYKFVSKLIFIGGLFAIIGTLHAMIWSVSILLFDVTQKLTSPLRNRPIMKTWHAVVFSFFIISGSSLAFKSEAIMQVTVFLLSISYILSVLGLFKEKSHRIINRAVCVIAILGGCLMGWFSLYFLLGGAL